MVGHRGRHADDSGLRLAERRPGRDRRGQRGPVGTAENGYEGSVVAYSWDSDEGDSIDLGWADAKDIADRNGEKLANFLTDWTADHDAPVRVVAHSLGARVTVDACRSLRRDFRESDALTSASLLGGAIEDDDPSLDAGWSDDEYGRSIEHAVGEFDNFYSDDDPVLSYIFNTREFDEAVGEVRYLEVAAPDNYADHDVTDDVDSHSGYYQQGSGVMNQGPRRVVRRDDFPIWVRELPLYDTGIRTESSQPLLLIVRGERDE